MAELPPEETDHYVTLCRKSDPEWLELRGDGISASDVCHLFPEIVHFADREALLAKKLGQAIDNTDEYMDAGNEMQEAIRRLYNTWRGGNALEWEALLRSKACPWLLATPDAAELVDGEWKILEIKLPSFYGDEIPVYTMLQVQTQLLVTGLEAARVAAFYRAMSRGSRPTVHVYPRGGGYYERDEQVIARIKERTEEFWLEVQAVRALVGAA